MSKPRWQWALLADASRAKLLHCGPSSGGSPHVKHVDAIEASWEGHERGRPSPLKGRGGNTYAAGGHEAEEDRRRFAQELAQWLQSRLQQHGIDQLTVFGPPKFVGALRRACPHTLADRLSAQTVELINLSNPQLHQHPAIRELIGLHNDSEAS